MSAEPMFFLALSSISTTFFLMGFFYLTKEGEQGLPSLEKIKAKRVHLKNFFAVDKDLSRLNCLNELHSQALIFMFEYWKKNRDLI
mmetsp:Transcript_29737/g.22059  ORF Transcript_29737/g.22059 Transcript_29737/m.22059 type:complete len:86 (+) Transcript_29737:167-424(+)